jgi:NAD+ kinase
MDVKRVLVIYKKSGYQIHAVERKDPHLRRLDRSGHPFLKRMRRIDRQHRRSLEEVERVLDREGLQYRFLFRHEFTDEEGYDLIVTVGGDGTLLLVSHYVRSRPVLGVLSARESVGYLCGADTKGFRTLLRGVIEGKRRPKVLHRLQARIGERDLQVPVLNEVLFTNLNPAATSRYLLKIDGKEEPQISSGVWIASAAGSTAAIKSAGGRAIPLGSRKFQYVVRELYRGRDGKETLRGSVLGAKQSVRIRSRMRHGMVYVDGPHLAWPVRLGETVKVRGGGPPLKVFGLPR